MQTVTISIDGREVARTYLSQLLGPLGDVANELARAEEKHAPMHSPHEGYAVIREELDELWEHVKADTGRSLEARAEAIQLAAMALRYTIDLCANAERDREVIEQHQAAIRDANEQLKAATRRA